MKSFKDMQNEDRSLRLAVGANGHEPLNHVRGPLIEECAEILTRITRRPNQCISKGQLMEVAETAITRVYVYERRLKVMRALLEGFQEQLKQLPADDPLAMAWGKIYDSFDKTLKGDHQ